MTITIRAVGLRSFASGAVCISGLACNGEIEDGRIAREQYRVPAANCVEVLDERGARVRLGPDCRIHPPPLPSVGERADGGGTEREEGGEPETPGGCPLGFFGEAAEPGSVRFAFPVWDPHTILTEPAVIHVDHSPTSDLEGIECTPFEPGHFCYGQHHGTDFMLGGVWWAMDDGVTVRAAAPGIVMEVQDGNPDRCHADLNPFSPRFGGISCAGAEGEPGPPGGANLVQVCHADGTASMYAHLMNQSITVQVGDTVRCGDPVGLVGSSGNSAAPHLHFEISVPDANGRRFADPYSSEPGDGRWVDQQGAGLGTLPATSCQSD